MGSQRLHFYNSGDRSGTTVELNEGGNIVTKHDFAPGPSATSPTSSDDLAAVEGLLAASTQQ
jgi:hypothetical protein